MKLIELLTDTSIEIHDFKLENSTFSQKSNNLLDDIEITHITCDSRQVKEGSLFICLKGTHTDGHRYIDEAVRCGASVIVTEKDAVYDMSAFAEKNHLGVEKNADGETAVQEKNLTNVGIPMKENPTHAEIPVEGKSPLHLESPDTRVSLSHLWNNFYGRPGERLRLIGVTGTNGKTSITFMLKSIFNAAMTDCGVIGTVSSFIGDRRLSIRSKNEEANMTTPDPEELYKILSVMADEGVNTVFMEVTSHSLALEKLVPLHFAAALFTNLTPDHIDFHGSMENYLAAKKKLFRMCDMAIVNGDDAYASEIAAYAEENGCRHVRLCTSGSGERGDYHAENIRMLGTDGTEYILSSINSLFKIKSPIPGSFTVKNTLMAASLALELGISPSKIQDGLRHMRGVSGRMEKIKLPFAAHGAPDVFIDYAHTPDALEKLLLSVRAFKRNGQRTVLLFGCGGDRDKSKRPIMGEIASRLSDLAIITSDNSRSEEPMSIIGDIMAGFDHSSRSRAVVIEKRAEAIDYAVKNALPGDIILLCGKGHEEYEIDKNGKHPFSEKELVTEAVQKYYAD